VLDNKGEELAGSGDEAVVEAVVGGGSKDGVSRDSWEK